MRRKTLWFSAVVFVFVPLFSSTAQDPTSRLIPFALRTSLPPQTMQEVDVQLWDAQSERAVWHVDVPMRLACQQRRKRKGASFSGAPGRRVTESWELPGF